MGYTSPKVIDLFAGAGGLSEGLAATGFKVIGAAELHPHPALSFAFNHPGVPVFCGDIHRLDPTRFGALLRIDTQVDLIVGGPPCQGFSTAGTKKCNDPRNDLFKQFARFVAYFKPRMFLLENVPGFKTMYDGRAHREARTLLESIGYECEDNVVDAASYGVPQRRKRFIMIGWLPGATSRMVWPTASHVEPNPDPTLFECDGRPNSVSAFEAISDLDFISNGQEAHHYKLGVASTYQTQRRKNSDFLFNHLSTLHRKPTLKMFRAIAAGRTIASAPIAVRSAKRTMARLLPTEISNAVLALPDDLIHYSRDRILTVREMARLQSFDDDFVILGKRTSCNVQRRVDVPQYTQVGNAVPPVLASAIGASLIEALGAEMADGRAHGVRRELQQFLSGTSGWNGYRFARGLERYIRLLDTEGHPIALPLSSDEPVMSGSREPRFWREMTRNDAWPSEFLDDSQDRAS